MNLFRPAIQRLEAYGTDEAPLARVSHQKSKRNDEAARFSKENDRGRHSRSLCTTSKAADRVLRSENRADPALQPVADGKSGLGGL